jgi:hypothetical protein
MIFKALFGCIFSNLVPYTRDHHAYIVIIALVIRYLCCRKPVFIPHLSSVEGSHLKRLSFCFCL